MRLETGEQILVFGGYWHLPAGGLGDLTEGRVIAVTVAEDGVVKVEPLDAPPATEPALVERFRRAYDRIVEEPDVPALVEEIVFELLADDRTLFDRPQPPLAELCREAGLEVRGAMAAHEERLWENQRQLELWHRAWSEFDDDKERYGPALFVLELARQPDPGRVDLKRALTSLADEKIVGFVVEELFFGEPADEDRVASIQEFASALIRAAGEGMPKVVAHWFAALIAERAGEVLVGRRPPAGRADGGKGLAAGARAGRLVRLRPGGRRRRPLGLLRRMPDPPHHALAMLAEFEESAQPDIGRNEPC